MHGTYIDVRIRVETRVKWRSVMGYLGATANKTKMTTLQFEEPGVQRFKLN